MVQLPDYTAANLFNATECLWFSVLISHSTDVERISGGISLMHELNFRRQMVRIALVAVTVMTMLSAFFVAAPRDASAASQMYYLYGSGSATGGKVITFRIELTEKAPSGGALVFMHASSPLVPVPSTVLVPAGTSVKTIQFRSIPTPVTKEVTVSATYGGVTKSRVHTVIDPHLSSMSVQTMMRAGGEGRILVRISGRAYAGGVDVNLNSNRDSVVAVPPSCTFPPAPPMWKLSSIPRTNSRTSR